MKYNKTIEKCSNEEIYYALLDMTKQMAEDKVSNEGKKKLYYISAEFLIGKLLSNNLINLGIYDSVKSELEASGKIRHIARKALCNGRRSVVGKVAANKGGYIKPPGNLPCRKGGGHLWNVYARIGRNGHIHRRI